MHATNISYTRMQWQLYGAMESQIYSSPSHAIHNGLRSHTLSFPNQGPLDRPDIVARVFKLKLRCLLHDIYYSQKPVFGPLCAIIYVVEWQQRGPPHAHILAMCENSSKPRSIDDYDLIVSAEIPNPETHPQLHAIVTKFMMHGPCGAANPKSPCMVDGQC